MTNTYLTVVDAITRETLNLLAEAGGGRCLIDERSMSDSSNSQPHRTDERAQEPAPLRSLDPGKAASLREAPEHFFEQEQWLEFISGCGGREAALRQIGRKEDPLFVFVRQRAAELSTAAGPQAREAERVARLGHHLVAEFCARLSEARFVATGFQPPSIERVGDRKSVV